MSKIFIHIVVTLIQVLQRNSKIHGKEPGYNKTSFMAIIFASPLALCYKLSRFHCNIK